MGYFGIQVHDKNGSICINSLLSLPAAGEDGENGDVFPWGEARAWSSPPGLGVGSAGCCAEVSVLHPTASTAQTMEKDVFPGRSRCFLLHCKGSCRERGSHPLPWIRMRVSYQASLTPHANSQLVLCYF